MRLIGRVRRLHSRGKKSERGIARMSAQPRDIAKARRLGALGDVLKVAPARELLDAVDTVLPGQLHLSAELTRLVAPYAAAPAAKLGAADVPAVRRCACHARATALASCPGTASAAPTRKLTESQHPRG